MSTSTLGLQPTNPPPNLDLQHETMRLVKQLIEDQINSQPRSLQKQIGPSEIGTPCDHCLAARLAGWRRTEHQTPWIPYIGTCVHAQLEKLFTRINSEEKDTVFLAEQKVTVGTIGGQPITGSTDLYMPTQIDTAPAGMTVDWKIVGDTTLNRVKHAHNPGPQYEVQAHLYAKGWQAAGYPTSHVAVYFMPRNQPTLDRGWWWIDEYRPEIAEQALERANRLWANLTALSTVSVEARDQWISGLPRASGCHNCRRYPDWQQRPDGTADLDATLNTK